MKLNILGSEWNVEFHRKHEDKEFFDNAADGWTDYSRKLIALLDKSDMDEGIDKEQYQKKVFRHELIHAFLMESGLFESCDWHCEEMVDWFAFQSPKIYRVFQELDLL